MRPGPPLFAAAREAGWGAAAGSVDGDPDRIRPALDAAAVTVATMSNDPADSAGPIHPDPGGRVRLVDGVSHP